MNPNRPNRPSPLTVVIEQLAKWGIPTDELRHELQGAVRWVDLDPRQELFAQGDPLTAAYFLYEGSIIQERITQDAEGRRRASLRREAHHGEWIGHYDLLYAQRYSANTRALGFAVLVEVQAAAFNRLIHRYPLLRRRIAPLDRIGRLRTIPLFAKLDLTALAYLADACAIELIPQGTILYDPPRDATHVFIVDQGQVLLTGDNYPTTLLGNGMAFGFLKQPIPRQDDPPPYDHQAQTTVQSLIITIPRQALSLLADIDIEEEGAALRDAALTTLAATTVLEEYDAAQQRTLLGYMSHYLIPTHHLLMQQGEVGDSLWILMPGSRAMLHALDQGQALQPTLIVGPNYFEEGALKSEQPIGSTVQAEPGSQWLHLHRDDFRTFARDHGWHLLNQLKISPQATRNLGEDRERRRYPWLEPNENLIIFQRRHWLALLQRLIFPTLFSGVVLILYLAALGQGWRGAWLNWTAALLGLAAAIQFAWGILDYLNDYLLVTNQRLVRQEKVLFITEKRQSAVLEQVRSIDITSDLLGKLFDYGRITIQTAATGGAIEFDYVPAAPQIKAQILEQQNLRRRHTQASQRMVIQTMLEDRFGLRLRLPVRVRPEIPTPPTPPRGWWERVRRWFDLNAHLAVRLDDRIIWRKHWILLVYTTAAPAATLALIVGLLVGQWWLPAALAPYIPPLTVVLVLFGLVALGWLAWNIADWRNDTYEIDDRSVVDVEKKPFFFDEERRTALLSDIENIEVSIPSPLHYLLNFGNVRLRTAAADGDFTFDWVPDPRGVADEIRRRMELYRNQQEVEQARRRAQELPDWFEMYNRMEPDIAQLWSESNP